MLNLPSSSFVSLEGTDSAIDLDNCFGPPDDFFFLSSLVFGFSVGFTSSLSFTQGWNCLQSVASSSTFSIEALHSSFPLISSCPFVSKRSPSFLSLTSKLEFLWHFLKLFRLKWKQLKTYNLKQKNKSKTDYLKNIRNILFVFLNKFL